jgi:3-oxoacyl-[acyl-carrier-protein] synthase III
VQTVEALFSDLGKNIDDTKEVLRLYGNMSSATVLYVLERFMDNRPPKGEKRLNVKFWPWIFSTTCFIAVLINNNISHQILRFFMLKKSVGLMTNEEIISKLPTRSRSYLLTK